VKQEMMNLNLSGKTPGAAGSKSTRVPESDIEANEARHRGESQVLVAVAPVSVALVAVNQASSMIFWLSTLKMTTFLGLAKACTIYRGLATKLSHMQWNISGHPSHQDQMGQP
jgi:hypothetical protein